MNGEELRSHISAYAREEWTGMDEDSQTPASSPNAAKMTELEEKCRQCQKCPLYKSATNLVFGEGSPDNGIMVIGEAPGMDEDVQGRPFVGRSGQLLRKTLSELGVDPSEVFIGNILKHRPPNNRNPEQQEILACTPWLQEQIAIIKPFIVITLGNFSTKFILNTTTGITRMRGGFHDSPMGFKVAPTFHPSAILRNINNLPYFKEDLKNAVDFARRGG